jgi:hypothetical protein
VVHSSIVHLAPEAQWTRHTALPGQRSEQSPAQVNSQMPSGAQVPTALGPTVAMQPPLPGQSTVQSAPQPRVHLASPSHSRLHAPVHVAVQVEPSRQVQAASA